MYSETPQLQPIVPSYRLRILSDEQLEQLQSATLAILENHHPEPMDGAQQAEFKRILKTAERELG